MAVVPHSRLLIKPPFTRPAAPLHSVFPSHPRSIVPALSSPLRLPSLLPSPPHRSRRFPAQSNGGASETLEESEADEERKKAQEEEPEADEKPEAAASTAASSAVAEELKQMMEARRKESVVPSSELWGGVAEEVREIEWPPFSRVLGTTGVVLAVIAGSSVALLTVNAILAEISDKVFAGKGIQDFF